ncbi:MAG TPA: hypothetical protein VG013_36300 [Gemmataceae bacterium]|nr:hypothetical protein [Gemmataceae bacterium]
MTASNSHYEIAERGRGITVGGIGAIHVLARQIGLVDAIDRRLELLEIHLPYHESDHVLALAYLPLCGGQRLEDLELLRNDEVFLNALGARHIPDPTTSGDFCRRFTKPQWSAAQSATGSSRENRSAVWIVPPQAGR